VVVLVVVGSEVAVIAVRLRPVQPVPSVGLSAIVRRAIARSRTVRSVIVHLRIVRRRGGVLPVVVHSVIDQLSIGLSVTAQVPRATVVQHFNRVTGLLGRMPAGHSLVQPVRNAARNPPARTLFGVLGLHSFPKVG